ncbi:MAG: DUF554 domain-containing protein [Arachnia sp.]
MFVGFGTVVNVAAVATGAGLGLIIGNRMPERSRSLVTDALGLVTFVLGIDAAMALGSQALASVAGVGLGLLIVIGALLPGALIGSWLRLTERLDGLATWLKNKLGQGESQHFVEAIVTPTLVFTVGPLTIMGTMSDGLGLGSQQLLVKSAMDGFASIAFAASLGVGVLISAAVVGLVQGSLTLAAVAIGSFLSQAQIDALTATGGIILLGLSIRLIGLKDIRVADLLPALIIAPILTAAVAWLT